MSQRAMGSLWRTLSGATGKEISHAHPSHPLRPTASMDISEPREENSGVPVRTSLSLPNHSYMASLESTGSLSADSVSSSSPTTSGGYLGSPTAAGTQQQAQARNQQQQHQEGGKRKTFKMHGMEPYDYWSMIKSL